MALAGGGVAAGGIFALERRRYLESRSRVSLAPERFLDLLSLRHQRAALTAAAGPSSEGGAGSSGPFSSSSDSDSSSSSSDSD